MSNTLKTLMPVLKILTYILQLVLLDFLQY